MMDLLYATIQIHRTKTVVTKIRSQLMYLTTALIMILISQE